MSDILGIYIVNEDGKSLYTQEFFHQGTDEMDTALLSNLMSAFQMFASEIGEGGTNSIELGNSSIFSIVDPLTQVKFLLRTVKSTKQKKMMKILSQIKNTYINIFTGHHHDGEESIMKLNSKLSDEIEGILGKKSSAADFLRSI